MTLRELIRNLFVIGAESNEVASTLPVAYDIPAHVQEAVLQPVVLPHEQRKL